MDILFTGGAPCQDEKSLQPLNLTRLRRKLFGSEKNDERQSGNNTPKYSEKVLTGNWYEDRIIPARSNDEWITLYKTNYKLHALKDSTEDSYTIWKNKQKTQGAGRKLPVDGKSYIDNMTSLYDLSYRILPKGLCGPTERSYNMRKNAWEPEPEFALSYGNQTNYGLVEAIKEKRYSDENPVALFKSIYQTDYIDQNREKDSDEKRFPKHRLDLNTPDLRHLGIDLSSKSKPIAREPQNRQSRCEKVCTWL